MATIDFDLQPLCEQLEASLRRLAARIEQHATTARQTAARVVELQNALKDAAKALDITAVEIADWGTYASDYFQEKYDLAGTVKYAQLSAVAARKIFNKETPDV